MQNTGQQFSWMTANGELKKFVRRFLSDRGDSGFVAAPAGVCQLALMLALCFVCGCAGLDFNKNIPWLDSDDVTAQPSRMTTLWTQTVLNQPGKRGVRGFGGRIMFHGKEGEKSVKVHGSLIIYAFDETTHSKSAPDRKFVFTTEQFESHYSKSKLGHSYSVWLPWDEVGGPPRRINLIARFEPTDGSMIMSDSALQQLPGISPDEYESSGQKPVEEEAQSAVTKSGIQQAGFQKSSATKPIGKEPRQLNHNELDTIELPPSFSRRLGSAAQYIPARTLEEPEVDFSDSDPQPAVKTRKPLARTTFSANEGSADTDRGSDRGTNSQKALMERQKELLGHFGRRKSQVQKASPARSKLEPPQSSPVLRVEQSTLPQSSSTADSDPVESDGSSERSSLR